jgi:hypothetical protein
MAANEANSVRTDTFFACADRVVKCDGESVDAISMYYNNNHVCFEIGNAGGSGYAYMSK